MRPVYAISGGVSKFAKTRPDKNYQAVIKEAWKSIASGHMDVVVTLHTTSCCALGTSLVYLARPQTLEITPKNIRVHSIC